MYNWDGMKKIDFEDAKELFKKGEVVYRLFDDNSEAIIFNENFLEEHYNNGGEFGIEV